VLSPLVELLKLLRTPLATALTRLPGVQAALAAMAQAGRWRGIGRQETSRGRRWQVFDQGISCGQRQVYGGSELIAELAAPFFQCQVAVHQAVGRVERGVAVNRQEKLPLAQQIHYAVGIFCSGLTRGLLHGLAVVLHRLTAHETDGIAAASQSVRESLPGDPGRFHGEQQTPTAVFDQVGPQGRFKAPASLTAMGKDKFSAGEAELGPDTGMMFGLAPVNSDEQKSRLLYIRFTRLGGACILFQAHGTLLLRG
jgi:hypothetical protein